MGFRADLDLSAILPRIEIDPGRQSIQELKEPDKESPVRFGAGATTVSSCTDIALFPSVCWDVNGYYRELGVFWKASKRELREAYQRSGGPSDARLTYVFRQLLQEHVRHEYDRMPLGSVFMDEYVQSAILTNAKKEAARRTNLGQWTSGDDILREWGFVFIEEDEETPTEDLTRPDPSPILNHRPDRDDDLWPYSFYKLGTSRQSVENLKKWQSLLLEELQGKNISFAVGWSRGGSGFKLYPHEGRMIFFLQEDSIPSKRIAQAAIRTYMYRYV